MFKDKSTESGAVISACNYCAVDKQNRPLAQVFSGRALRRALAQPRLLRPKAL